MVKSHRAGDVVPADQVRPDVDSFPAAVGLPCEAVEAPRTTGERAS